MRIGRRRALGLIGASCALGGLAACQVAPTPRADAPAAGLVREPGKPGEWTAILPSSDLAVGPNRFLYAVLDERNRPIVDARVHLRFFDLALGEAPPVAETDAVFRGQGLGARGVYVARVDFPRAGDWGVEAQIQPGDGAARALRTRFEVRPTPLTPAVGSAAPPSEQALTKGAADPKLICTASPPCAFHDLTIADALARKLPALILFATPAYCTSAVCGPDLEHVQAVEPEFRGHVSFIHVEIYADPNARTPLPTVEEWRLPSEPWVFLIDRDGRIADKLEGGITPDELKEGLARLV